MSGPNNENSDGLFAGLPAEYQQVMSPKGVPARPTRTTTAVPNGVPGPDRGAPQGASEAAYEQALGIAHVGEVRPLQGASSADGDDQQGVRASEPTLQGVHPTAALGEGDRPLLPHSAVGTETLVMPTRATSASGLNRHPCRHLWQPQLVVM